MNEIEGSKFMTLPSDDDQPCICLGCVSWNAVRGYGDVEVGVVLRRAGLVWGRLEPTRAVDMCSVIRYKKIAAWNSFKTPTVRACDVVCLCFFCRGQRMYVSAPIDEFMAHSPHLLL